MVEANEESTLVVVSHQSFALHSAHVSVQEHLFVEFGLHQVVFRVKSGDFQAWVRELVKELEGYLHILDEKGVIYQVLNVAASHFFVSSRENELLQDFFSATYPEVSAESLK